MCRGGWWSVRQRMGGPARAEPDALRKWVATDLMALRASASQVISRRGERLV